MSYEVKEIYVAPSSQPGNKYAYGKTNEQAQCQPIAEYIVAELENYHCGVHCGTLTTTPADDTTMANAIGCTSYYSIHTNAGGGKGVTAIYQSDLKLPLAQRNKSKLMATSLCSAIESIGRINRGPIKKLEADGDEWYGELRNAKMAATILEIEFHDWITGARWIVLNKALIGKTIARTIAKIEKLFRVYPATTTANLNVRSGAGVAFPILYTLPKGDMVTVYSEKLNGLDVWCRIHPTEDEWVSKKYLQR